MASVIIHIRCKIIGIVLLHCEESPSRNLTYTIVIVEANTWSEYCVITTNILFILTHSIFTITQTIGTILITILHMNELKQRLRDFPRTI